MDEDRPIPPVEHFDPQGNGFGFLIETTTAHNYWVDFSVRRVEAIHEDGEPEALSFLTLAVKWDSCCHLNLDIHDDDIPHYAHLCGVGGIADLIHLLKRLYAKAYEVMGRDDYDPSDDPKLLAEVV